MSTVSPVMGTSPTSQKRTHDEANATDIAIKQPTSPMNAAASSILTPVSTTPSRASTAEPQDRSRQSSPAASSVLSSAPTSTSNANANPCSDAGAPPAKKRKLTFAEREVEKAVKRREKEEKERQKAEEKSRKEEEKRKRDEEKRQKQEEKEEEKRQKELEKAEKQKAKDAEKHAKEDKKRKDDEEKQKKERSQMRLNAFFRKPAQSTPGDDAADSFTAALTQQMSRRSSTASIGDVIAEAVEQSTPAKKTQSDYERYFPSFFLHHNTTLAPWSRYHKDEEALNHSIKIIDSALSGSSPQSETDPLAHLQTAPHASRRRGRRPTRSLREIVNEMNGTASAPINLTADNKSSISLDGIRLKILSYHEDVRPPYRGTYTRKVSDLSALKLSRKPFTRALPDTNYDYDSEAEWEPPQEGDEDLGSEDEDESDDGEEEMDGFLDDEDDAGVRRGLIGSTDMQPVSTGLVWQDETKDMVINGLDLNSMRIDAISDEHKFPIDPFSTSYWAKPVVTTPAPTRIAAASTIMLPPNSRSPLLAVKSSSAIFNQGTLTLPSKTSGEQSITVKPVATPATGGSRGRPPKDPSRPLKMIQADLLPQFRQAVAGSNLSKAGLIEVLKKHFPKIAKDVIKDTLTAVAVREGAKEADKVWVLVPAT